ncbi:MAG: threonine dehydratase [Verrucomicrobiales bacterium]|jgi:threonine dehydratase
MAVSDASVLGTAESEVDRFFLKLELLQYSGTFKARGASNYIASMPISDAGVVAASGGNHGAAVAWAAGRAGHRATIFVPTISSPAKVDRLRSYGADVHQVGAVYAESLEASMVFQEQSRATSIHAYNHPVVMAGAGTTGAEFVDQVDALDTMLVACGGGGLAGGIACAVDASIKVVVCETETTNAYAAAVAAGEPVDVAVSGLAADALGATRIGELPWQALSAVSAPSVTVTDDELAEAQDHLWNEFRIIVEPSAATTIAALRSGKYLPAASERVGILLCGANTAR